LRTDLEARIDAPFGVELRLAVALGGAAALDRARARTAGRGRDREARAALAGVVSARTALTDPEGRAVQTAQGAAARLVRARRRLHRARAAGLALLDPGPPSAT
jgi:hypothetical protein